MKRFNALLLPLLACLLGEAVVFQPTLTSGFRRIQADLGDTRLNNYNMERGYRWLKRDPQFRNYWNPPFYYPQPNLGGTLDVQLGSLPPYAMLRTAGLPSDTAFQGWMMIICAFNFAAAYLLLVRVFSLSPIPASAGSYFFAFSVTRINHMTHQQLLVGFFLVLALFAACRWLAPHRAENESRRYWIAMVFFSFVVQLYTGFYIAYLMVLAGIIALGWALVMKRSRATLVLALRRDGSVAAVCAAIAFAAALPVIFHYRHAAADLLPVTTGAPAKIALDLLPAPLSWFNGGDFNPIYRAAGAIPLLHLPNGELALGFGFFTPVLALFGLWRLRNDTAIRIISLTGIILVLLVTRLTPEFSLWSYVAHLLPGAYAIRAPGRVIFLLLLPAALGLASACQWILALKRGRLLVCLPLALIFAEQYGYAPSADKLATRMDVAAIAAVIQPGCRAFYFAPNAPRVSYPFIIYQLDAMWASVESGIPTVNGFTALVPQGYTNLHDPRMPDDENRRRINQALESLIAEHHLPEAQICVVTGDYPARW